MPYDLQIDDATQAYLDNLPLSDAAKARVWDCIDYGIRNVSDAFRNDPANRPYGPGSTYFFLRFILLDRDGDQQIHILDFTIDDAHASAGVLLLAFVDHSHV
jgi:hypothetical protein